MRSLDGIRSAKLTRFMTYSTSGRPSGQLRSARLKEHPIFSDLQRKMTEPDKNLIKIEPGTLILLISALLLIPLLVTGFFAQ